MPSSSRAITSSAAVRIGHHVVGQDARRAETQSLARVEPEDILFTEVSAPEGVPAVVGEEATAAKVR
jgi:hypothetical protein